MCFILSPPHSEKVYPWTSVTTLSPRLYSSSSFKLLFPVRALLSIAHTSKQHIHILFVRAKSSLRPSIWNMDGILQQHSSCEITNTCTSLEMISHWFVFYMMLTSHFSMNNNYLFTFLFNSSNKDNCIGIRSETCFMCLEWNFFSYGLYLLYF